MKNRRSAWMSAVATMLLLCGTWDVLVADAAGAGVYKIALLREREL